MVGPASRAVSSGKVALVFILALTIMVVAYIVTAPAPMTSNPPTSQYTSSGIVQTTTSSTGLAMATTTSSAGSGAATISSATTTSFATTLVSSSQTPSNLILEGGMSGSQKPGGTFDAILNSSTRAELTWSAPGFVTTYLHNSTGALVFARSGSSGNYTFCVPATGTYTEELQASGSETGPWSVYLYEVRGSSCTPAG